MNAKLWAPVALIALYMPLAGCHNANSSNAEMTDLLKTIQVSESVVQNPFYPAAGVAYYDSVLQVSNSDEQRSQAVFYKAGNLLELGKEQQAADLLEALLSREANPS
ncbi:MAG: hypothetical protein ABUM51_07575, partial [Bacteroidota bacterium]